MPTAEQLKSLVKAHYEPTGDRFRTIVLQIAAHEAKIGHAKIASDIKKIVDNARTFRSKSIVKDEFSDMFIEVNSDQRLNDLVLPNEMISRIKRIEKEFIQKDKLQKYGLTSRRKLLFAGKPGTGKTMTAYVIANELGLPLNVILMEKVITKFMGETSAKLRQIFDYIRENQGVYLFDEFDAIGTERTKDNEVGEMRRVLNSFLQFIESDDSESIIIAATNNLNLLDQALFRRFDDVIHYEMPNRVEILKLIRTNLGGFIGKYDLAKIIDESINLSHAEITLATKNAVKDAILSDKKTVDADCLIDMIQERVLAYGGNK